MRIPTFWVIFMASRPLRLEQRIVEAQRELASELLFGAYALEQAEQIGVSLAAMGIPEPPNPWKGLVVPEPPWEEAFVRALRKLEPLRRTQVRAVQSQRRELRSRLGSWSCY